MGFFDNLAETAFRKAPDGSDIYYPNGWMGKGRIVRESARRQKLFNYQKRIYKYAIPLMSVYGAVIGASRHLTIANLVFIGVVAGLLFARQRYLIAGLAVYSENSLTFTEFVARRAKAFHPSIFWFFGASSLILIAGTLALPILIPRTSFEEMVLLMISLISFGIFGLALSIYLYKARKSNNSIQPTRESRG